MTGNEPEVLIVGAGPTGMTLAGELALAGVDVLVVERRAGPELPQSRSGGLHARTLEVFDQRGIADRFVARGQKLSGVAFASYRLDIGDFPTRFDYQLGLWQNLVEAALADWIAELGVEVRHGVEVTGFEQDDTGVTVTVADGEPLRAGYLVGCDGGRSRIRKSAGIAFPGWDATFSCLLTEVHVDRVPPWITGTLTSGRPRGVSASGTAVRLVVPDPELVRSGDDPSLDALAKALVAAHGDDYGVHDPMWISRFTDASRQASAYRDRRVLLAGDAAHIHAPVGGQGLNLGVQDAVNLGWKLARVVAGTAPSSLLDSYHAERHPVAARALRHTMAQVALNRNDDRTHALRELLAELLGLPESRRRVAAMLSGLDIRYDLGEGHPLLGRRMPDLDLTTANGPRRVFALLHRAEAVLLNLGEPGALDAVPLPHRVRVVDAGCSDRWELPVLGVVDAPAAVLIRPDGYVAWTGDRDDPRLPEALATWFGPPSGPSA